MNKAILAILGIILALMIVDQLHRGDSLAAVRDRLDALDGNVQQMSRQQRRMREEIERLSAQLAEGVVVSQGDTNDQQANRSAEQDGRPKLGVNFLLPYDGSQFDPDKVGGDYRIFDSSIDEGFNDILVSRVSTTKANNLINDALCELRPEHPELYSSSLATSCVISDDYKKFVFTIRRGVLWHVPPIASKSGFEWLQEEVEMTAHDFVFYLDMIMRPDTECAHLKVYFENIKSIKALDDYTLEVCWKETEFINVSQSCGLSPLPRHVYKRYEDGTDIPEERLGVVFNEHWFDKKQQLIGVGAYMLVEADHTKGYLFRSNPTYWGTPEHFDSFFWDPTAKKPEPKLVGFKNNEVQTLSLVPHQYKAEIVDRGDERFAAPDPDNPKAGRSGIFAWEKVKASSYGCWIWNMRRPQLRDKQVRHALAHCYPRQRIMDEIIFGLGQDLVANVHPDHPHYNTDLKQYAFDLERAAALLDEAGWKDTDADGWRDKVVDGAKVPLRLDMVHYVHSATAPKMLAIYKDECKKVGIDLNGIPVDGREWGVRAADRNFDGFSLSWSMPLQLDFKQLWHSDGANDPESSNYPGFANAEADDIIAKMRKTFDDDERGKMIKRFQAIIHDEQPYLFQTAALGVFSWHNKPTGPNDPRTLVKGWEFGMDNYHPLRRVTYRTRYRMRWYLGTN